MTMVLITTVMDRRMVRILIVLNVSPATLKLSLVKLILRVLVLLAPRPDYVVPVVPGKVGVVVMKMCNQPVR